MPSFLTVNKAVTKLRPESALSHRPGWSKKVGKRMNAVPRWRRRGLLVAMVLSVVAALGVFGTPQFASAAIVGNTIAAPGGKCVDVGGDDTGVNGTAVQLWDCQTNSADQHWSWSGTALTTIGRCLDVTSGGTGNGALLQLYDCNGTGA